MYILSIQLKSDCKSVYVGEESLENHIGAVIEKYYVIMLLLCDITSGNNCVVAL